MYIAQKVIEQNKLNRLKYWRKIRKSLFLLHNNINSNRFILNPYYIPQNTADFVRDKMNTAEEQRLQKQRRSNKKINNKIMYKNNIETKYIEKFCCCCVEECSAAYTTIIIKTLQEYYWKEEKNTKSFSFQAKMFSAQLVHRTRPYIDRWMHIHVYNPH